MSKKGDKSIKKNPKKIVHLKQDESEESIEEEPKKKVPVKKRITSETIKEPKKIVKKKVPATKKTTNKDSSDEEPKKKIVPKKKTTNKDPPDESNSSDEEPKKKIIPKKKTTNKYPSDEPKKKVAPKKKISSCLDESEESIEEPKKKVVSKKKISSKRNESEESIDEPNKKASKKILSKQDEVDKKVLSKKKTKNESEESLEDCDLNIPVPKKKPKYSMNDNKILEFSTSQTSAFKQVIEKAASICSECTMTFTPPDANIGNDEDDDDYFKEIGDDKKSSKKLKKKERPPIKKNTGGLRMSKLTEEHSILLRVVMEAANFDYFCCKEPKIIIGVDMYSFHQFVKTLDEKEPITFYMTNDNRSVLYIKNVYDNDHSNLRDLKINLIEIHDSNMQICRTEFANIVTIPHEQLNKICKNISSSTEIVDIVSSGNSVIFSGGNDGGEIKETYYDTSGSESCKNDVPIHGSYELKNILLFSRCGKLCDNVIIYFKEDYPLILHIPISTLGKMYVFLTPRNEADN